MLSKWKHSLFSDGTHVETCNSEQIAPKTMDIKKADPQVGFFNNQLIILLVLRQLA